jgi:hypothetical protein
MNYIYIYIYGYNLLPLTLSDPNNSYPSYSQHYLLVSAIIIHNPKPVNHNQLRNKLSLFLFIYNLFLPTLSDLNSNYPSYSQHYPLILVITNHNPKLGSHTPKKKTHTHTHTQHATIGNKISQSKFHTLKINKNYMGIFSPKLWISSPPSSYSCLIQHFPTY